MKNSPVFSIENTFWVFAKNGSYHQLFNTFKSPRYEYKTEFTKKPETNLSPSTRHGLLKCTASEGGTKPTQPPAVTQEFPSLKKLVL